MTFLLTEPLSSLYTLINFGSTKRNIDTGMETVNANNRAFSRFPPSHKKKIESFIVDELGGTLSSITLVLCDELKDGMRSDGSLSKRALMIFSSKFVSTFKQDLTPEQKFVIAREYGHLFHDDYYKGELHLAFISHFALCSTYAASALALTALSFSPIPLHLLSVTIAKVVSAFTLVNTFADYEIKADRYAASQSETLRGGGIAHINSLREKNIKMITDFMDRGNTPELKSIFVYTTESFEKLPFTFLLTSQARLNAINNGSPL